ncbi:3-keto-steroid reductase [[Candida] railenensis]|uniref:3beta-hydroxysteroid 3-dehydrogenase n=1 Tax=[Candida] railenensis TaxID=45579 RepID=A0A9P0QSX8_9ASCO|nr:3-keto-steroid reductase [[Candida] railenensis]
MTESKVCLITGTSSNLGINIAYRILKETPKSTNLTFIVTSRTLPKITEVITQIQKYAYDNVSDRTGQLEFDYLTVDFSDMISVLSAYYELNKKFKKIDYAFINSAQGVYSGIDWIGAVKEICTSPLEGVTNPTYKLQRIGVKSADGMGLVFQANVFGPYYLIHKIKHLLKDGGKIIWISSLMGQSKYLSFDDLELVQSPAPYEGSKRLIDLMHSASFRSLSKDFGIQQYLVHPGIFTSYSFFQYLNVFTYYGMLMLFYIARFLGSPWHNISGYTAANAPVYCVKEANERELEKFQPLKIGSATTRRGEEYLVREEVDTTGSEDVVAYLEKLCKEWDAKLADQIVNTRQP